MNNAVTYSKNNHVGYITLNRLHFHKESNSQLTEELKDICTDLNLDQNIYAIVLTGKHKTFYLANESSSYDADDNPAIEIANINKPVIAAINGDALGPGLELALACDIRIASNQARFGLPQIIQGYIPSNGGTQRLPRLIGRGKALELILSGDIIDAAEAFKIGLVNKIVSPKDLLPEVEKIAAAMADKGPFALKYAKEAVLKGTDLTLEQGLRLETDLYMLLHTTYDRAEGITAFQQKRTARFKGK